MQAMTRVERKAKFKALMDKLRDCGFSQETVAIGIGYKDQSAVSHMCRMESPVAPTRDRLASLYEYCESLGVNTNV